jgi:hypothetical protein
LALNEEKGNGGKQGLIEITMREGSAAAELGAKPGDPVRIHFEEPRD